MRDNLPANWYVKNDGSQLFKDTVIKYLNNRFKYEKNYNINEYYGVVCNNSLWTFNEHFKKAITDNYIVRELSISDFENLIKPPKKLSDLKEAYSIIHNRSKQKLLAKNPNILYPIVESVNFINDENTYVYVILSELYNKYDISISDKEYNMSDNDWNEYIFHMKDITKFIIRKLKNIDNWYIIDDGTDLFKNTVIKYLSEIKNGHLILNYNGIKGKCWGVYNGSCYIYDNETIINSNISHIHLDDFIK